MQWSREILIGVFNGTIVYWNHHLITQLNPFILFPAHPILLVTISGYAISHIRYIFSEVTNHAVNQSTFRFLFFLV